MNDMIYLCRLPPPSQNLEARRMLAQMTVGSCLRSVVPPRCHFLRPGRRYLPNERRVIASSRWSRVTVANDAKEESSFLTHAPAQARAPSSKMSVLLCGEGDFSFARALASSVLARNQEYFVTITATSFEPEEEIKHYWGGATNLQELHEERFRVFVEVLHGVDATALDTTFRDRTWDKICFMFPHIAGKGKISLNRKLLAGFFGAATHVLSPGGTVEVALVAGQGGTAADGEARRDYGNTWQVVTQAAEGGMVLCETATFDASSWEILGYRSRGHWRGLTQERGFAVRDGVVHFFRREGELDGATCPSPVRYPRDVSFWVNDPSTFSEATLQHVIRDTAGAGVDVEVFLLDEWQQDEKMSRTYRITYFSSVLAFTRQRANVCQFALRNAIEDGLVKGATLR